MNAAPPNLNANNACKGCNNHGQCLDAALLGSLQAKQEYSSRQSDNATDDETEAVVATQPASKSKQIVDFDKDFVPQLVQLRNENNHAVYEARLNQLAAQLVANCEPNEPQSVRDALNLSASEAFAQWSNETAHSEMAFCNVNKLLQL